MKRKYLAVEAVALLVLVAVLLWYNIPFSVNQQIPALEIKMDDPDYCVERTVTLDGKRYRNLFSEDLFCGTLAVGGYEDMIGERTMDDLQLGSGYPITYSKSAEDDLDLFHFGNLHVKNSFKDAVITFVNNPDGSSSTENCYVIVANVADRQLAHAKAQIALFPSESE